MKTKQLLCALVLVAAVVCVPAAWPQQKDPRVNPPATPYPPLSPGESSSTTSSTPGAAPAPQAPDKRPLTGVEDFTLGSSSGKRSYIVPSLRVDSRADTNSSNRPDVSRQWNDVSTFLGRVSLEKIWSRYKLAANYAAGGVFYSSRRGSQKPIHSLAVSQTISGRRWSTLLSNSFSYLPESPFGFGGLGTSLGGTSQFPNINPNFNVNQTILTGIGGRISDTAFVQGSYQLGRRSSLTGAASFGLLRFLDQELFGSNQHVYSIGYEYKLREQDSLSVSYGASLIRFLDGRPGFDNHTVSLGYGRRITGRLATRTLVGAQFSKFSNPLSGPSTRNAWNLNSTLTYSFPETTLSLGYSHFTNGGGGALRGAESDVVTMGMGRKLSRLWSAGWNFRYAHNQSLRQTNPGSTRTFNTWNTGFTLRRPVGRYAAINFDYNFQWQNSNTGFCIDGSCGLRTLRHQFGMGFNWSLRPLEIED